MLSTEYLQQEFSCSKGKSKICHGRTRQHSKLLHVKLVKLGTISALITMFMLHAEREIDLSKSYLLALTPAIPMMVYTRTLSIRPETILHDMRHKREVAQHICVMNIGQRTGTVSLLNQSPRFVRSLGIPYGFEIKICFTQVTK